MASDQRQQARTKRVNFKERQDEKEGKKGTKIVILNTNQLLKENMQG